MTDEEFHDILAKLQGAGFSKLMANIEMECIRVLVEIAYAYDMPPIDLIRKFGNFIVEYADHMQIALDSASQDDTCDSEDNGEPK